MMHLKKVTPEQAREFSTLADDKRFRAFFTWLADSREVIRSKNDRERDDMTMHWRQGACQLIEDISNGMHEAKEIIKSRNTQS